MSNTHADNRQKYSFYNYAKYQLVVKKYNQLYNENVL